ncbi:RNA-binding S4 domain-containing protein [Thiothrix nivea]|uniref:Heat shock protein 15 n=1 Tax=Thiothrix nivea (strain ATCC 35100 / DSM 5205 / JP2) TaxID=870187 RepID=A0A656HEZ7_THINJ|nr:RNA-binding S4 domain-containing protein [Thiothrix nivea]EIJ35498.1 RNA-binding S4 domain protein [Thiothrix nivea DSM 5205]
MAAEAETVSQRIDKWLWAARFFKTRPLAVEAVEGGHVHVNKERVKPSRNVRPGDEIRITKGFETWVVTVRGVNAQRRPATEARLLYEESEHHREQREAVIEERRLHGVNIRVKKPDKRERRLIEQMKKHW